MTSPEIRRPPHAVVRFVRNSWRIACNPDGMLKRIGLTIAVVALATACRHKPAEGPAERAGKSVDNAAHDTKEAVKDGAEATKDAAKDTKNDVKKKTN